MTKSPLTLAEVSVGRDNNLNLIRLVAATSVVISHAFLVTGGLEENTGFVALLGQLAVWVFFTISGFLIAGSFERAASPAAFIAARLCRIMPALIICVLLTGLVVGPLVSKESMADYFSSSDFLIFILGNLTLYGEAFTLPGVFSSNPAPVVQLTFWTLKYEAIFYGAVFLLGMSGTLGSRTRLSVVLSILLLAWLVTDQSAIHIQKIVPDWMAEMMRLGAHFMLGVAAWSWKDRIVMRGSVAAGLAVSVVLMLFSYPWIAQALLPIALTYGILWLAFVPRGFIRSFNRLGDYSYGIYIYGVLIQQLVWLAAGGDQSVGANLIATALPLAVIAVASWHLVEKPAMSQKAKVAEIFSTGIRRVSHP